MDYPLNKTTRRIERECKRNSRSVLTKVFKALSPEQWHDFEGSFDPDNEQRRILFGEAIEALVLAGASNVLLNALKEEESQL